jgi:hypothetical protein
MDVCILDHQGEVLVHRQMQAGPAPLLQTIAPSRAALVVWGAWLFTWSWRADLWAREGLPCVRGHALSMQAIPEGKATHAPSAAQQIAVLLRGGRLPQAAGSPAQMRAPRALLRHRRPLRRPRAAVQTHSQATLPERGQTLASNANRAGVAPRCAEPAVPQSLAGALALLRHDDPLRNAGALPLVHTAQQPDAPTCYRRPSVPGLGQLWRLVLRDASHDLARFPRVQAGVSSCRVVTCATASAGKREGTSGTPLGNAAWPWAGSEAAGRVLRAKPAGQQSWASLAKPHGPGQAFPILAQHWARAV